MKRVGINLASVALMGTVTAACSAAPVSGGIHAETAVAVTGGARAEAVADMIDRLQQGEREPCRRLVGDLPMATSDVIGPASAICERPFAEVIDIVQSDFRTGSTVTVRERQGAVIHSVVFGFRDAQLLSVTSGWPFPSSGATGS